MVTNERSESESWERGQNERHNGLLRRYIPKGESLNTYTQNELDQFIEPVAELDQ